MTGTLALLAQAEDAGAVPLLTDRLVPLLTDRLVWAVLIGAVAFWLVLPRHSRRGWSAGVVLGAISLGLLASLLPPMGGWLEPAIFWTLSVITVVSAAATISVRSPVYSAIWFALTLLTTAGLFLLLGAQFLGVATVVVYAGAILVTFLFVLMLAQPQGHEYYDRVSWGWFPTVFASVAAVLLVGGLTHRLTHLPSPDAALVDRGGGVLSDEHMLLLGSQLFTRHLVSVEVAGALLLVALVGALAIVLQGRQQPTAGRSIASRSIEVPGAARPAVEEPGEMKNV